MIQKNQDDSLLKGILVFAPLYFSATSLHAGFSLGLMVFVLISFLILSIYLLRKFIPSQQTLVFVLILGVFWLLIVRMLLEAEVYFVVEKVGLFLPLLLINSWVLSVSESMFSMSSFKSVMSKTFSVGMVILLLFVAFGSLQDFSNVFSIITSPAAYFFFSGFLLAAVNFLNQRRVFKL